MPGKQVTRSSKPYLTIVGGSLCQKVDKETPNARFREYELSNGTKGSKYELVFSSWEGIIRDMEFVEGDYGDQCKIHFDDAVIVLPTAGRYFSNFAEKVMNADLSKSIVFHPFDMEGDDGKRVTGVSVQQDGEKLKSYYWTGEKKEKGFPEVDQEKATRKTYWKAYFSEVEGFLADELSKLEFTAAPPVKEEDPLKEFDEDVAPKEVNQIGEPIDGMPF